MVLNMTNLLTLNKITKKFGEMVAVEELSFEVEQGEILGIMGPNGAGKTTVFNLITGVLKPENGNITFKGEDITTVSSFKRCRKGIGRTYQIPMPFEKMTVFENLLVASVHGGGLKEKNARKAIYEILELTGLASVKDRLAGALPLLDRKRLELGRALATDPVLLLLDEVASGLTEKEAELVLKMVKDVQHKGISVIWIEHILMMMSEGVDRLLVISQGSRLNCGKPDEMMKSKDVLECYLGEEER